jgi:rRNA maturation protein Nop10
MTKLKKCEICKSYTLKNEHCKTQTKDAHYKFIKIRDVNEKQNTHLQAKASP